MVIFFQHIDHIFIFVLSFNVKRKYERKGAQKIQINGFANAQCRCGRGAKPLTSHIFGISHRASEASGSFWHYSRLGLISEAIECR
jgi:hypothetical protein